MTEHGSPSQKLPLGRESHLLNPKPRVPESGAATKCAPCGELPAQWLQDWCLEQSCTDPGVSSESASSPLPECYRRILEHHQVISGACTAVDLRDLMLTHRSSHPMTSDQWPEPAIWTQGRVQGKGSCPPPRCTLAGAWGFQFPVGRARLRDEETQWSQESLRHVAQFCGFQTNFKEDKRRDDKPPCRTTISLPQRETPACLHGTEH